MLIKTPEFTIKFLTDLSDILYLSSLYKTTLAFHQTKITDPNQLISTKRLFKNIRFVGSYVTKNYNTFISDIDLLQIASISPNFILRIQQIISNKFSNFKFMRVYCGEKKNIQFPWTIDENGECIFLSFTELKKWVLSLQKYISIPSYTFIYDLLINSTTISLYNMIQVEKILEQYTKLVWSAVDIKNGYKIEDDIKYDLLTELTNTKNKVVFKFLYIYNNKKDSVNTGTEYCMIDLALNQSYQSKIVLYNYLHDDPKSKFKFLKFCLQPNITEYLNDIVLHIGYLATIAARLDLLTKVHKYNVNHQLISEVNFKILVDDMVQFALKNKYIIKTTNLILEESTIQKVLSEKFNTLYLKFRQKVINPTAQRQLFFYELRSLDGKIAIPKKIIQYKLDHHIKCPFFKFTSTELKQLIDVAILNHIQPPKLHKCIQKIATLHKTQPSTILNLILTKKLKI